MRVILSIILCNILLLVSGKEYGEFCEYDYECTLNPRVAKTLLECSENKCSCLPGQHFDYNRGICLNGAGRTCSLPKSTIYPPQICADNAFCSDKFITHMSMGRCECKPGFDRILHEICISSMANDPITLKILENICGDECKNQTTRSVDKCFSTCLPRVANFADKFLPALNKYANIDVKVNDTTVFN